MNLALLALCLGVAPPAKADAAKPPPRAAARDDGRPHRFSLTALDGRTVTPDDLAGKVWVGSFVVVVCPDGKCPQVTRTMADLQRDLLPRRPDVMLVSFVVKGEGDRDGIERLAKTFGADPERWLFLTGSEAEIDALMRSVRLRGPASSVGSAEHAQKLVVFDRAGQVRGWFDGMQEPTYPEGELDRHLANLKVTVDKARLEGRSSFPEINATLNALASVLIAAGWLAILNRVVRLHVLCMVAALVTSAVFLACYLYYHLVVQQAAQTSFRYRAPDAPDWVAYAYWGVLLTHVLLAVVATPMALVTAYLAARGRLTSHVRLARWTMPIWLYVSVTGVVVYWMLYRLYAP